MFRHSALGFKCLIHSDNLTRVGGESSEDGSQTRHGTIYPLVVDFALRESIDEVELLLLVTADSLSSKTPCIFARKNRGAVDIGGTL